MKKKKKTKKKSIKTGNKHKEALAQRTKHSA